MIDKKIRSMRYAMKGMKIAFRNEHNFRFEVVAGVTAIFLGLLLELSLVEWLMIFFSIGFVLAAEVFNTALEELCDMLRSTHDPHVEKIKDLSAAAVFIASFTALLIGALIFLPKIL
ncbi:MAG: hypothetical protein RIQ56_493 [Candidatus Parcubacteria bacterium]|jgi:undecaprenol kinase/diacylglycerol kinase (ATP)